MRLPMFSTPGLKRPMRAAAPALLIMMMHAAFAQTVPAKPSVTVNETRRGASEATDVIVNQSRVLSYDLASSCNFMAEPKIVAEAAALAYLGWHHQEQRFSEFAPGGDASMPFPLIPRRNASGCGAADLRFAAGRSHIARKDRTLAQAFEAYD